MYRPRESTNHTPICTVQQSEEKTATTTKKGAPELFYYFSSSVESWFIYSLVCYEFTSPFTLLATFMTSLYVIKKKRVQRLKTRHIQRLWSYPRHPETRPCDWSPRPGGNNLKTTNSPALKQQQQQQRRLSKLWPLHWTLRISHQKIKGNVVLLSCQ